MGIEIEVNTLKILAEKGETILSTLVKAGIKIPTLCNMKDLTPSGACRMCVVEVEGKENLVPGCSYLVEEGMHIHTHSPRVIRARRTLIELLLSNHPDDCLYCERNSNCELQNLAAELNIRERRLPGIKKKTRLDKSSAGIVRDPGKCILCGRCVRTCEEIQCTASVDFLERGSQTHVGTSFNKDLNFSSCIQCGQCLLACPTSALTERLTYPELEQHINDQSRTVVVQISPISCYTIAEEFGLKPGKDTIHIVHAAVKKLGFDLIYDSSFGSDVQVLELANELVSRLKESKSLPLISSCCPSWVKYAEQFRPEILPNLSTCRSSQQIMGALMRTYLATQDVTRTKAAFSVSIMPCISRKYESQRAEMSRKGVPEIDCVLSTRELIRLLRIHGINMHDLKPLNPESRTSTVSSTGLLMGNSGGLTESLIRSFYFLKAGADLNEMNITKTRGNKERKEYKLKIGEKEYGFVVMNGLIGIHSLLNEIRNGRQDIHFIEVMACRGGCVAGGGQPIHAAEGDIKSRSRVLYEMDERAAIRAAHKNSRLNELYSEFLNEPLGVKCKSIIHTYYSAKEVLL